MTRKFALAQWLTCAAIFSASLITFAIALATVFCTAAYAQGGLADIPLPPDEAEQKKIVADVRAKALEYERNLPDYVCTQFSHHNIDLKGTNQWKTLDTVSEQLRVLHGVEEYTLIAQNGKKASGSEKRPADLVSIKEFSDVLRYIFDPEADPVSHVELVRGTPAKWYDAQHDMDRLPDFAHPERMITMDTQARGRLVGWLEDRIKERY